MPSPDALRSRRPIRALVIVGALLAIADLAVAFLRTAIPRELSGVVTAMRTLSEKHAGVDDVCLLTIGNGPPFQVEHALFDQLTLGDHIEKSFGSRTLKINTRTINLPWSHDLKGMLIVMPALLLTMLALASRHRPPPLPPPDPK